MVPLGMSKFGRCGACWFGPARVIKHLRFAPQESASVHENQDEVGNEQTKEDESSPKTEEEYGSSQDEINPRPNDAHREADWHQRLVFPRSPRFIYRWMHQAYHDQGQQDKGPNQERNACANDVDPIELLRRPGISAYFSSFHHCVPFFFPYFLSFGWVGFCGVASFSEQQTALLLFGLGSYGDVGGTDVVRISVGSTLAERRRSEEEKKKKQAPPERGPPLSHVTSTYHKLVLKCMATCKIKTCFLIKHWKW